LHNFKEPLEVEIKISGPDQNSNFLSLNKDVKLDVPSRIVNFELGALAPGNYKLSVDVKNGLNFKNETSLLFEPKSYSVFIQIDKAIYKPGQTVFFRAIIVQPSLNKAETGANNVYIIVSLSPLLFSCSSLSLFRKRKLSICQLLLPHKFLGL
jgi:thioester-containing protein, putative